MVPIVRVNMNRVKGIIETIPKFYPEMKVDVPQPTTGLEWLTSLFTGWIALHRSFEEISERGDRYRTFDDGIESRSGNGKTRVGTDW